MSNSALLNAILQQGQQNPLLDAIGAFQQGQQFGRQRRVRELSGLVAQGGEQARDAFSELQGLDPEIAFKLGEQINARDARAVNDFIRDARIGKNLLKTGDSAGFLAFADQRINQILNQGGDPSQTERIRDLVAAGNVGQAVQELQAFENSITDAKQLTTGERNVQALQNLQTQLERGEITPQQFEDARRQLGAASRVEQKTPEQIREETEAREGAKRRTEAVKKAINQGEKAFTSIAPLRRQISLYDEALDQLDAGAGTGFFERRLPSLREASARLDAVRSQLGLNVLQMTTFGALSEKELEFALDTALPSGLSEKALRKFIENKRKALQEALVAAQEAARKLSSGNFTLAEILEQQQGQGGEGLGIDTTTPQPGEEPVETPAVSAQSAPPPIVAPVAQQRAGGGRSARARRAQQQTQQPQEQAIGRFNVRFKGQN